MRKKLVMFEGLDCCGKDTQIKKFTNYLDSKKKTWKVFNNPIDKRFKEDIKQLLSKPADSEFYVNHHIKNNALGSLFLFDKLKSILPGGIIEKELNSNSDTEYIIMNRFYSSLVYNFDKKTALDYVNLFRDYLKENFDVDLIVIEIIINAYASINRLSTRIGKTVDRFENLSKQINVDAAYSALSKLHPNYVDDAYDEMDFEDVWIAIDGCKSIDEVANKIKVYFDILINKEEKKDKIESLKHIIQVIKILPQGEEVAYPCVYLDVKDPGLVNIESYLNDPNNHMLEKSDISSIGDKFIFDRYILFMPDSPDVEPITFVTHRIIPGNCWTMWDRITEYSGFSLLRCEFIFGTNGDECLKLTCNNEYEFNSKLITDLKLLLSDIHAIPYIGVNKSEVSNIDCFYKVKGLFHDNIDAEKKSLVAVKFRVKESEKVI